jgi:hypothetical protein
MSRHSAPFHKDRRDAPRAETALTAYLVTHGGSQLRGCARNLSRSGVFVEIKAPGQWLVGESGRLVFTINEGNVTRLAGYSVLIVREASHGVGVVFWRSLKTTQFTRGL